MTMNAKKLRSYVEKIERCHASLDTLRSEHMLACKDVRGDIKQIIKDAKAEGLAPKALKAAVKHRALMDKAYAVTDGLDLDEQSQYEQLHLAFGEPPQTDAGGPRTAEAHAQ